MKARQTYHNEDATDISRRRGSTRGVPSIPVHASSERLLDPVGRVHPRPAIMRTSDILALQQTVGNQAVARLLEHPTDRLVRRSDPTMVAVVGRQATARVSNIPPAGPQQVGTNIQRLIAIHPELQEKKNTFGTKIGTVSRINTLINAYNSSTNPAIQKILLNALSGLSADWLAKHGSAGKEGAAMLKVKDEIRNDKYRLRVGAFKHSVDYLHAAASETRQITNRKNSKGTAARDLLVGTYGLTSAELLAIKLYTGSDYAVMNAGLEARAGQAGWLTGVLGAKATSKNMKQAIKEAGRHEKMILSGLAKMPAWAEDAANKDNQPLFRGEAATKAEAKQLEAGGSKQFNSFVSTSKDRDVSWVSFMRPSDTRPIGIFWKLLRYKNGKGLGAAALKVVQTEGEVLFPPGTTFVIDKVTWSTKVGLDKKTRNVKELEAHEA